MLKKFIGVLVIIVILGGGIFVVRTKKSEQFYSENKVVKTDIHKTINVDAVMNPNLYADITSELPTRIKSINVELNDQVEEGQVLFELDKKSIAAQVNIARLEAERAELAEKEARRHWHDLKPESRESIKKASEEARQRLREVYAQADKTTVTSPIDGIVVEQNARVGEVAEGRIMRIINPESLQVEALIPEVDIAKVKSGDRAFIKFDAYPDKTILGTFKSLDKGSTVKQNNTYFNSVIDINDKTDITILDGMNADVDIEIDKKENVLAVPRKFAKKDDKGYFVYVLSGEKPKQQQFSKKYFQEGIIGNDFIEVVSGLSVGEKIVNPGEK